MEKPLHTRKDFIASIAIPLIIAILTASTIAFTEPNLTFCFSSACYSEFVQIFKIPLTISALAFPLAGIVAAYHRSLETTKQIAIAESNNTFSNYIKHRDDFISHLEGLSDLPLMFGKFRDVRIIYKAVFPKNTYMSFDPSSHLGEEIPILKEVRKIVSLLNQLDVHQDSTNDAIFEILSLTKACSLNMSHYGESENCVSIEYNDKKLNRLIYKDASPLQSIYEIYLIRDRILDFCNMNHDPAQDKWNRMEIVDAFSTFVKKFKV